ncbi:MAG: IS110 family transposase [Gordonibacter sp.]|uniref:IS110 family transposase n=2 Tax=Gordonibacter sp. TaxID=1968902 RepID=UPI002FC92061
MLFAGIDIAKYDHVIGAIDERGHSLSKPMTFKNSTSGFEKCAAYLDGLADDGAEIMVGMEATGHYWLACFCFLTERGFSVVVINPMRTDAMRRFKNLGKVKTDAIDCVVIADTLRCGDFEPSKLADEKMMSLRQMTRLQQAITEDIADLKRQIIVALDQVFPEYARLFSDTFGETSKAFLKRCPTPEECMGIDIRTLTNLLDKASHGKLGREKADELKAAAKGSCGITLASDTFSFQIKLLAKQIEFIEDQLAEVDEKVKGLLDEIEPLILTIPGISYKLGAPIVAEIGDVKRFSNAPAIVKYAGINPSKNQSGTFEGEVNHITKQGSPYLRRALYLAAMAQLKCKTPLYDYYVKKRGEGKAHREALIAVARKLIHVIYAVLSKQEPYDPTYTHPTASTTL